MTCLQKSVFLDRGDKESPHTRPFMYYGVCGGEDTEQMSFCYYVTEIIFMKD